jgi:oligoribonuclease
MTVDGFVFIDLETTGLNAFEDQILEIGMALYDNQYRLVDSVESLVLSRETRLRLLSGSFSKFIFKMHGSQLDGGSGLIDDLQTLLDSETLDWHRFMPPYIEDAMIAKAKDWGVTKSTPVCGSSIAFDRAFMGQHMPRLNETFSYRNIDVSSDMEKMKAKYPALWAGIKPHYDSLKQENKDAAHRVLDDIAGSARLAKMIDNEIWDAAEAFHSKLG